jgi:uncharacterized protein YprB with RNaseH-like and TPR domain
VPFNFARLKKEEIVWMSNHRCRHGHRYIEHPNCYTDEVANRRKIGFFDIETSNLNADFGIVLSWYILDEDNVFHGRSITRDEVLNDSYPDHNLMVELVETFNKFDLLYGYYSTKFDFPFVRSRCVMNNIPFPGFGSIKHKDVFYIIKNKFKLHRRTQEVAAEMLLGKSNKTHWSAKYWIRAIQGDQEALDYIDENNRIDCIELKALTEKVIDFSYPVEKSI